MELSFRFSALRSAHAKEIQLQEVRVFDRGMRRIKLSNASNPGGESPTRQGPRNVLHASRFKWVDTNFWKQSRSSRLDIIFDDAFATAVAYEFITANDNPGRDPTAWSLSARGRGSGAWVTLDTRTAVSPPRQRIASYGTFWLPMLSPPEPPPPSPLPPPPPHAAASRCIAQCDPVACTRDRRLAPCAMCRCRTCDICRGSRWYAARMNRPQDEPADAAYLSSSSAHPAASASSTSSALSRHRLLPHAATRLSAHAATRSSRQHRAASNRSSVSIHAAAAVCNRRSIHCTRGACHFRSGSAVLFIGDSLLAPPAGAVAGASAASCAAVSSAVAARSALVVENRAVAGIGLAEITRIYSAASSSGQGGGRWSHVVVSGGINDIRAEGSISDVSRVIDPQNGTGLMTELVTRLLSDGLKVVLVSYPEGEETAPGKPRHAATAELRARYKALATRANNVSYVDGSRTFGPYPKDAEKFAADRAHPSKEGSTLLARAIGEALSALSV